MLLLVISKVEGVGAGMEAPEIILRDGSMRGPPASPCALDRLGNVAARK